MRRGTRVSKFHDQTSTSFDRPRARPMTRQVPAPAYGAAFPPEARSAFNWLASHAPLVTGASLPHCTR